MISLTNNTIFKGTAYPPELRFQRPYEGWTSRTNSSSVPDGLSMTAVLIEKHLAAGEVGWWGTTQWRTRSQMDAAGDATFSYDSVAIGGNGGGNISYRETALMTRGIAFGPSDVSCPYPGNSSVISTNGPTIGSWHPGNQVNILMADGAVRSIGSDGMTSKQKPLVHKRFESPETSGLSFEIPRQTTWDIVVERP
jgi:prepilin-type processing-associated H-X9-DG protein